MAKSRRKKNYKLRRRVMRTVAALTMIMAIVVAAIPVENYGTMRAAVLERTPWDETGSGNEYPTSGLSGIDVKFSSYNIPKSIQEVSNGYLSDIVQVNAINDSPGADAVLKGFLSTTSSTTLDVRENMFYQYKTYTTDEINAWVKALQERSKKEYFQLKYGFTSNKTVTRGDDSVQLPNKFDLSNAQFSKGTDPGTANEFGFVTSANSFGIGEVFSGQNAFFKDSYNTFVGSYNDYNDRVAELENFQVTDNTTDVEWDSYKQRVAQVQQIYDEQFSSDQENAVLKIEVNPDLNFSLNTNFYLESFCDRVSCENPNISLQGFTLESCYESGIDSDNNSYTNDIYVVRWNGENRDGLGNQRARYVDHNGYLANGSVRIVGVDEEAFKDTQITTVILPNSIEAIGNSAFENSRISNLQFNPRSCKQIGNRAFYGCNQLSGINLTNSSAEGDDANQTSVEEIGAEAFYGTGITEIVFPDKLKKIGDGCFAESALVNADFSGVTNDLTIGQYAFFNCNLNGGVDFSNSKVTIDKAAFAVSYNTDTSKGDPMESFVFPDNMVMKGDYILAGRTHLRNVTLPGSMSETVKKGTFKNCEGLSCVTLGALSYNENKGSNIKYEEDIFGDVENTAFYVQGPGYKADGTPTESRKTTIEESFGLTIKDGGINVPYKFLDADGTTRIEQIQGNVIAEIQVIDEDTRTARLMRYRKKGSGDISTVIVGDDVAGYHIISLESGCFDQIRGDLVELVIKDNTLTEIGNNALKGASKLERVTIGNSVSFIGTDAFADCGKLEDIYFNQPLVNGDDWSEVLTIASGAFRTNSSKLTFHGVVQRGYGPFVYAMDGATAGFTNRASGKNICYQSLVEIPADLQDKINDSETPSNDRRDANSQIDELQESGGIKLIRDNEQGLVTLIDYPHVDKMEDDVKTAISSYIFDGVQPNEEQARLLNAALNISIPEGVQSIDTKAYFSSRNNADNKEYVTGSVGGRSLSDLYTKDGSTGGEDYIGGLFSGYFSEKGQGLISPYVSISTESLGIMSRDGQVNLKQGDYEEEEVKGNDHLTSIVLSSTVEDLPEEYAFDSCENLISVTLGSGVRNLGKLPFRGCSSLENVAGNGYYMCENGILYGKSDPDAEDSVFDRIVECLETRGNGSTSWIVRIANDPNLENVKTINEGAFSNCTGIVSVDFSGTKITQIPKDCFKGSSQIQDIVLPDSIISVQEGAFKTDKQRGAIDIWVYNQNCDLDANAFDDKINYTIHAYEYTDNTNTTTTYVNNFCQTHSNIAFEPIEPGWTVRFRDTRNGSIIETLTGLETGANINTLPDMDAYLTENPYEGFVFDQWLWTDSEGVLHYGREAYSDIREDREIYAQFKPADYIFTGEDVTVNIVGGTLQGSGVLNDDGTSIVIPSGSQISIAADESETQTFLRWSVSDGLGERWFDDVYNTRTMFRVPNPPESGTITITANFLTQNPDALYTVTVNNGTGGGTYHPGDVVTVSAYAAATGQNFDNWTTTTAGVAFADPSTVTTTFIMPAADVVVTANYTSGGSSADGTYTVTVGNGSGGGSYRPGATVTIIANAAQTGQTFVNWTTTTAGVTFANANAATTTFVMPSSDVVVTANYNTDQNANTTFTVTVNNGTGGGQFAQGATVTITANTPNAGASFVNWTTATTGVTFASETASTTTFTMPASNVTVTANFSDGTGGQPSGGSSTEKKYKVTVNYGSGSGEYAAGATVNITANAPESSSRVFSRWTTSNSGLGFANANAVSTSFVMPAADVTVTANYKTRSSDDDDDSSSPSKRPGTNTSTTTVDNRPSSTTSTSTTSTVNNPASGTSTTNNNNGNRIYITKNGISNTDVASLAVSGSTDNFIVRITESPEATAAVEQALTNTYGSLNGLAYLPMDISLYDSTGQNKITDTTGLNVTVTMPIPDVLIQYGGNARVAAADNGVLRQITPRFTTIDGIACISFIPPHFSPYVIYVDTNNLIAGQMYDATPATGDPIHPKWFAAIGMACVSILLFVMSDGRKRKKYRAA